MAASSSQQCTLEVKTTTLGWEGMRAAVMMMICLGVWMRMQVWV
jgi:hypothetical protein